MFKVARKNLLGHKLRALFTAIAVALGVGFMAGTFVLTDTVSSSFDTIFTDAFAGLDAQVRGESAFEASSFDGGPQRPDLDPSVVDVVRKVDGVATAEPVVQSIGSVLDDDGGPLNQGGAPSFGANWTGNPAIDVFTVEEGQEPEGATEAVVDELTAEAGGFEVGETIGVQTIQGKVELELVGIVRYGETGNLGGASFVMMETEAAIDTFGIGGQIQNVAVIAEEGLTEPELVDRIEPELPEGTEAITATEATEEAEDAIGEFVDTIRVFLTVFAAIALAAGAFLIYNTFGIIIGQRVRELALLRALGSSRRQVLSSVVLEAGAIGLIASVMGLLGGIVLAVGLQSLLATTGLGEPGTAPVVLPRTIVVSILVGVVVSVLCSIVPARRASQVAPVAALRENAIDEAPRSPVRLGIGAVLVVGGIVALVVGSQGTGESAIIQAGAGTVLLFAGVVVFGPFLVPPLTGLIGAPLRLFGVTGTIGRDNARRSPKRSAGTAAALMLSVTLITFIAVFALSFGKSINASIDEDFEGDIEVIGAGFGFPSLGPQLVDDLAEAPEVAAVTGIQRGSLEIDGATRPVYGVRFEGLDQVFDLGATEGDITALGPEEIAIDQVTATEQGWAIGDDIDVTFPSGETATLTVGAIYANGSIVAQHSDGHYLVSDEVFREQFPGIGQLINRVDVTAADGVGVTELRAVTEEQVEAYPAAEVRDVEEIKEHNNRQLSFSLAIFFALLALALVIGALGVAITLALSVFERTREIGLLRAVGATRRQIAGSICGESIVLTLLGTILGLLIGIAGGVAVMRAQRDTIDTLRISVSPTFVIGVLLLAVVIGVGASLIPGWRAARMDVLDAVTVE
ncbi:ABC transporter permease [Iamia sp.]|uniref:ABC transporter permease n=1 Tax=Iamia sp. TaxID=2722710 RepID=UPI002C4BED0C|nr:FtsX-like permease family protein [Iamia sp.]HXH58961.1 FtsX-like permease family protein [Iamia sp.]